MLNLDAISDDCRAPTTPVIVLCCECKQEIVNANIMQCPGCEQLVCEDCSDQHLRNNPYCNAERMA